MFINIIVIEVPWCAAFCIEPRGLRVDPATQAAKPGQLTGLSMAGDETFHVNQIESSGPKPRRLGGELASISLRHLRRRGRLHGPQVEVSAVHGKEGVVEQGRAPLFRPSDRLGLPTPPCLHPMVDRDGSRGDQWWSLSIKRSPHRQLG